MPPRHAALVVFLAALAAACGDATGSSTGLNVSVTTGGMAVVADADGYTISVDGGTPQAVDANGTLSLDGVTPGTHQVAIAGLATNCRADVASKTVTLERNAASPVAFTVRCGLHGLIVYADVRLAQGTAGDWARLYAVDPEGGTPVKLLAADDVLTVFTVAPGGETIVYGVGGEPGVRLVIDSLNGRAPRSVTSPVPEISSAAWSPDGLRLAYAVLAEGSCRLREVDAGGSGERPLIEEQVNWCGSLGWSRDGGRLAYVRVADAAAAGANGEIYTIAADGTDRRHLTTSAESKWSVAWSPVADRRLDGTLDQESGVGAIGVMNADGTHATKIADTDRYHPQPTWSPDGQRIAFVSNGGASQADIFVTGADGSGTHAVVAMPDYDALPVRAR